MQIHRNKAAALIALHHFTPRLVPVSGNQFPGIAFDIPWTHADGRTGEDETVIRPDKDGLYSSGAIRAALGY